ncbi:MAG TPA: bifunctional phosphopantothenoylcysteine decarboxylase/phosphopantothenate--cysteine ligase CoaBC [Acidimicrobiales bacterium]|nr:bifunctional phosphopantothenoylcysteine decarboxylase/phosphopantothenate--cysteine ligase CoaBC [Acidimicrobiales bacterium]
MTAFDGRRIVVGVSGGIAAYKAVELCRRLLDAGAFVSPLLTAGAQRFVTATTFSAVASEVARTSLWEGPEPSPHTSLGQSADLVIVAPATARVVASYALGLSDDLLATTLLATRAPVVMCPAMHTEMWEQPAVQANLAMLRQRGVHVIGPGDGHLAGGDTGPGRMAEPAEIVKACADVLAGRPASHPSADLAGLHVLVTAGGTREPLDPVRFLGNRSSGRQGHAVAAEAAQRGARVTLVTASDRHLPPGVETVAVDTAQEMYEAVLARMGDSDVVVMAAAVADFRPKQSAPAKMHRDDGVPDLVLEPTPDILAAVVARRPPGQTVVGFAAEWGDVRARAEQKLQRKRVDLLVANDVSLDTGGFDDEINSVAILSAGMELNVGPVDKRSVARAVLDAVLAHRRQEQEIS